METELKVFSHHFASKLPVELIGGFQDGPRASGSNGLAWTRKSTPISVARPLVLPGGPWSFVSPAAGGFSAELCILKAALEEMSAEVGDPNFPLPLPPQLSDIL